MLKFDVNSYICTFLAFTFCVYLNIEDIYVLLDKKWVICYDRVVEKVFWEPEIRGNESSEKWQLGNMGQNWEDKVAAWKKNPFYLKGN